MINITTTVFLKELDLLVRDICGRLNGVKAEVFPYTEPQTITGINVDKLKFTVNGDNTPYHLITNNRIRVKPYLRPMSSMTEEEQVEFEELFTGYSISRDRNCVYHSTRGDLNLSIIDWLIYHHFDYRGLIPMGLALEAPEDMYKN